MIHILSTKVQNTLIWTVEIPQNSKTVMVPFLYNWIKTLISCLYKLYYRENVSLAKTYWIDLPKHA